MTQTIAKFTITIAGIELRSDEIIFESIEDARRVGLKMVNVSDGRTIQDYRHDQKHEEHSAEAQWAPGLEQNTFPADSSDCKEDYDLPF